MLMQAEIYQGSTSVKNVTFNANDLTEALKIVCTTQEMPEGADRITIEPVESRRFIPAA